MSNIINFPEPASAGYWGNYTYELLNAPSFSRENLTKKLLKGLKKRGFVFTEDNEECLTEDLIEIFYRLVTRCKIQMMEDREETERSYLIDSINLVYKNTFPKEDGELTLFHNTGENQRLDEGYEPYSRIFTNNYTVESSSSEPPLLLRLLATRYTYGDSGSAAGDLISYPNTYRLKDNNGPVFWYMIVVENCTHY